MPEVWVQSVNTVKKILGGHGGYTKSFVSLKSPDLLQLTEQGGHHPKELQREEHRDLIPLHGLHQGSQRSKTETLQYLMHSKDWAHHLLSLTRSHRVLVLFQVGLSP